MSLFKILNFVEEFRKSKSKAKEIKANPEKQPKSKRFGVGSIVGSVLCVAFTFLLAFSISMLMTNNFYQVVAGGILGILALGGVIASLYKAIEFWAFQLYINKKPITWISLAILIIAIAGSVAISVIILK